MRFSLPVDMEYNTLTGEGFVYAQGSVRSEKESGFTLGKWEPVGDEAWKTHNTMRARLARGRVTKPAPPSVLKNEKSKSGGSFEQKSKNLPNVISTG